MANMSVYTYEDKLKHAERQQMVSITLFNGVVVEGFLTSQFKISSNPEYEPLLNMGYGKFKLLETAMKLSGSPIFASTEFNNRFYKGGNYISFPIEFRVLDYNGEGLIRTFTDSLVKHTLPNELNISELVKGTGNNVKSGIEGVTDAVGGLWDIATGDNTTDAQVQKTLNVGTKKFTELQKKAGVGPVFATIGDMLSGEFLLTNVDITWSSEFMNSNDGGLDPLYADFTITLETPSIPNKNGTGSGGNMKIKTESLKRVIIE